MSYSFRGTGVAIVTPFQKNFEIDYNAYDKVINHTISGGVNYIVVLGTTGESVTLNKDEKKQLIEFTLEKVNGRVPVVVGVSSNNTAEVIELVKKFDLKGISGLLSAAPSYNKPSQKGLYEHFKALAGETDKPVILYNVPGRTASNIASETTVALAHDIKNIVAIKEASGNMGEIMRIIRDKPNDFEVLSGDDALTLPLISIGAVGVISVISNSHPQEFTTLVNSALKGDFETARHLQCKLIDLFDALFEEGNPSGIKAVLNISRFCENVVRLPLTPVSEEHYIKLQALINKL